LRTLKVVVIALGGIIIAGIAALVIMIAGRFGATQKPMPAAQPYAPATVAIPHGAEVVDTQIEGERLVLTVRLENGDMRFVVVNLSTGKEIGSVDVREAPGKAP